MAKSRVALIQLWPSMLVLAVVAGMILLVWYPYPFLQFRDNDKLSLLLILSAGLVGPALAWLVNGQDKSKRALIFDLAVITLIQVAAIAWGTMAIYQNRPYFMVFTVDRFEVLSLRDVDLSEITQPGFLDKPATQPVMIYANMPKEPQQFQKLLKEIMFEGKPDLQFRPEFWSFYADKQQLVPAVARPLSDLRQARPESAAAIDKLVLENGADIKRLKFVPGLFRNKHFATILDANSGEVVDNLVVNPWVDN